MAETLDEMNEQRFRLFAIECAKRALSAAKVDHMDAWTSIAAARRFAEGHADEYEREAAHRAALDAACDASREASRNRSAAERALWAAAWASNVSERAAAREAAKSAAEAVALAEREWQEARLQQLYDELETPVAE